VLYDKIKRNELRARLKPTDEGEWFLSLTDPTLPRGAVEIDTWNKPEQLTVALDRGLYIYKKLDKQKAVYPVALLAPRTSTNAP
jgi:hypothetical protein